jgi:membrane protease YdiL (CAAX protease family)
VHSGPGERRRRLAFVVALVVALTAWNNLVVTRLPGPPTNYVAANAAATALLLLAARAAGLSWDELGLARRRVAAGARWGLACFALVAAGYLVALAVPALRPLLGDARVSGVAADEIVYRVLVRIPLGTVVWEEVAFRGVLLAALARLLDRRHAVAVAAAVFGLWHVRPTLSAVAANDLADEPLLVGLAVLLGCVATAVAGVVLSWLRLRSGSLLAPALLHLATNALGTLAAAASFRLG